MSNNDVLKIQKVFKNKDIVSLEQFDAPSIKLLFKTAQKIKKNPQKYSKTLSGKLATLIFYEPSSRTFSSFAAAIKRLGGQTIEYQNPLQTSSAVKGETLADTVRVFENYVDIIIMRHFEIGAAKTAAFFSSVPIINAGDGAGEHPTQALLDMFTIYEQFKSLDRIKGVLVGDLLYGRTVHSLIKGLSNFKNITLYLLSPQSLKIDRDLFKKFNTENLKLIEIEDESEIPDDCNFWYWTRVQKERFSDKAEYERLKHKFILTEELLKRKGNKKMLIMHPLPRVGEIETGIDTDPRAVYLTRQIKNGMYVRMALLAMVLGKKA